MFENEYVPGKGKFKNFVPLPALVCLGLYGDGEIAKIYGDILYNAHYDQYSYFWKGRCENLIISVEDYMDIKSMFYHIHIKNKLFASNINDITAADFGLEEYLEPCIKEIRLHHVQFEEVDNISVYQNKVKISAKFKALHIRHIDELGKEFVV